MRAPRGLPGGVSMAVPARGSHRGGVAVTGAAGFVGSAVVRRELERGQCVMALIRACEQEQMEAGIPSLVVEWSDARQLRAALAAAAPRAIIHCAGAGSRSAEAPAALYEANAGLAAKLLDGVAGVCPQVPVVLLSSAAVYGPRARVPVCESASLDPATHYGFSKALTEQIARAYSSLDSLHLVIARPFNVVGPREPRGSVVHSLLAQLASAPEAETVRVALRETASVRDFVDVSDVADALVLLADEGEPGGLYNVCTGVGTTVGDMARVAADVTGRRLQADVLEPDDPGTVSVGSPARLMALGWSTRYSLGDSLLRAYDALLESDAGVGR